MSLFDYIDWRGDLLFSETGLNEVDNLILSQICYVDFDGIVSSDPLDPPITLRNAARQYLRLHRGEIPYLGKIVPPEIISLLAKAAKSKRFSQIKMMAYTNQVDDIAQLQFSAITFLPDDNHAYIAYRGTDDTLVGWKENFNMSFMQPVPAQIEAVAYLERIAPLLSSDFFIGGHSKGGNLAVYAAVKASPHLKARILTAFNNDGPGFDRPFINGSDYQSIRGKIRTIIPHSSVVGMLLEHEETYEVIKSNATGLLQHNAFSWEPLGGSFIHLNTVTEESRLIDTSLKEWMYGMSVEERAQVVDSLYETLSSVGAKTITELSVDKLKLVKAWNTLDSKTRSVLLKCVSLLIKPSSKSKTK